MHVPTACLFKSGTSLYICYCQSQIDSCVGAPSEVHRQTHYLLRSKKSRCPGLYNHYARHHSITCATNSRHVPTEQRQHQSRHLHGHWRPDRLHSPFLRSHVHANQSTPPRDLRRFRSVSGSFSNQQVYA